jgi:hypothetical protein
MRVTVRTNLVLRALEVEVEWDWGTSFTVRVTVERRMNIFGD